MSKSFKGGPKAVDTIVGRLYTKKGETARGMERGLMKAGLFLQRESQKIVPVDTGTLKNTAFTRKKDGTSGFETEVVVGYRTDYDIYVHEDLDAKHKPGKYAKFLETPSYGFRDEMIAIIRREAKKG